MKNTLVMARRDLADKRFVLLAPLAFAILSAIVPLVAAHAGRKLEVMIVSSGIVAIAFTLGLATVLGATFIGRDLSDGRLSFYFSKPVAATAIWFGKLLASLILIVVSFFIIAAPALLSGARAVERVSTTEVGKFVAVVLIAATALLLVTHVIGTFIRSRSLLLALDFLAAVGVGFSLWFLARPLILGGAVGLLRTVGTVLAIYVAGAIVAAGAWQLAAGRTDRARSHFELSRFLWLSIAVALLITGAFVAWVISATPADLIGAHGTQSRNNWMFLTGHARNRGDYLSSFLYSVADGRYVRMASFPWRSVTFSADGRTAAWMRPALPNNSDLFVARLDSESPRPVETGLTFPLNNWLALSADGSRAAIVDDRNTLSVYEIGSKRSLGSVHLADVSFVVAHFVTPDQLRIYARTLTRENDHARLQIFQYDVSRRALRMSGELPMPSWPRLNGDLTRMAIVDRATGALQVRDALSGSLLATLQPSTGARFVSSRWLADGSIAALESSGSGVAVRTFDASGVPGRRVEIPSYADGRLVATLDGNRLLVVLERPMAIAVVDVAQGRVIRLEQDLRPVIYGDWFAPATPMSASATLCATRDGRLLTWNPATGEKRPIGR
jgi:ABC-type transport system involved in multi-copper enzyme maturation permease subunit